MTKLKPSIGVGVLVVKDGKILLGKRKGKHFCGYYGFPGGKLDYMETFEQCAKREVMEETGIKIKNLKILVLQDLILNNDDALQKHFADIGFQAEWQSGTPKVVEPDKCEFWDWYYMDRLPKPLFPTIENYIEAYYARQLNSISDNTARYFGHKK